MEHGGTWWNCLNFSSLETSRNESKRMSCEVKELYGSSMELELLRPVQENHTEVRTTQVRHKRRRQHAAGRQVQTESSRIKQIRCVLAHG